MRSDRDGGTGFDFWNFRRRRRRAECFEFTLEFLGAAGETGFLVVEIGEDFGGGEARVGDGNDLVVVFESLEEIAANGLVLDVIEFGGDEVGLEGGDAAEAPADVGEFGDGIAIGGAGGWVAIGVGLMVAFVFGGVLVGEEGQARGEGVRAGVAGGGEFPVNSTGSGRELRIGAVGLELFVSDHGRGGPFLVPR